MTPPPSLGVYREKRIALAAITLEAARLPKTTDHLHLCLVGAWVSGPLYRRPLMCVLQSAFSLVDTAEVRQSSTKVIDRVANELVMLAALSHLVVADVAAPWSEVLCATDSSEKKGAIAEAKVGPELTKALWCSSQKAAESTRLLSRVQAALRRIPSLKRPLALRFHFLEVCGGSSKISAYLSSQGWLVGPPLDLSFSAEYNLLNDRVFLWIVHLLEEGLLDSLFISPPCTTFSLAAHPPLRTFSALSVGMPVLTECRSEMLPRSHAHPYRGRIYKSFRSVSRWPSRSPWEGLCSSSPEAPCL